MLKVAVVVLTVISVVFIVAFAVTFVQYDEVKSKYEELGGDREYSYCQTRPECISSTAAFAQRFNVSVRDGYFGPACVSETILGRVIPLASEDPDWMPTALGRTGYGSRISFSISAATLEKLLPLGAYDATSIVRTLGFGDSYTCGTAEKNWKDCQYRLVLWKVPCREDRPPITQGYWDNLEWFYQTYVYGPKTPDLTDAIEEIKSANGLFEKITGCDVSLTPNNYWDKDAQVAAGCSEEFIEASTYYSRTACTGENKNSASYVPGAGCIPEDRFLSEQNITAAELRAYLMQNEGFNPYYTGYGYTANSDFYAAQQEEFWYPNDELEDLLDVIVIKFYNGTHGL